MNAKVKEVKVENKVDATELFAKYGSKSATIRALAAEGKTRSEIKKITGLRYQHVRNVLITPIKKAAVKVETATNETKV
jgi:hypothetical protein